MKKVICLLITFATVFLLTACQNANLENTKKEAGATRNSGDVLSATPINSKDIERVLNRKIFVLKESTPEVYKTISDIESITAYKENWSYKEVVNEKNFSDISWETTAVNGGKTLTFNGTSKKSPGLTITISFILQNEDNTYPLACDFSSSDGATISVETIQSTGVEGISSFALTDANISCLIVFFDKELEYKDSSNTNSKTSWDFTDGNPIPFSLEEYYNRKKDPNWYDNGIFSTYIESEHLEGSWEYEASFDCNMTVNPYDYTGFQVYTHQCEDAQRVYHYLVPISPAGCSPEVYALSIDEISADMKLVFVGQQ